METGSTGGVLPLPATGDAIVLDVEDDFESVYDVPFITVNKIGSKYLAEVVLSGDVETDLARVQTALDVGATRGVHAYARVYSDLVYEGTADSILIHFTADHGGL
jgi:hypothetical protein